MAKLFLNSFHSGHSKKTHTTAFILLCASVRRTNDLKIKIGQRSALTAGSPHCHRFSDNDTRHKLIATPKISTRPCSTLNRQRRRPRLRHSSSSSCSSSSWASSAQALRRLLVLVTGFALAFDLGLGSSFWLLTVISGM